MLPDIERRFAIGKLERKRPSYLLKAIDHTLEVGCCKRLVDFRTVGWVNYTPFGLPRDTL